MPIPFALMAAGTIMQVAGTYSANMDQAQSEIRNASFFREQANFARDGMIRDLSITESKYAQKLGSQYSAAAAGGADVGFGSVALILAQTAALGMEELIAARKKGEIDIHLASMRGDTSTQTAGQLNSNSYNALQAGSSVIKTAAEYKKGGS